jgi:fructose transport system permease protein
MGAGDPAHSNVEQAKGVPKAAEDDSFPASAVSPFRMRNVFSFPIAGPLFALIALVLVFSFATPTFFAASNFSLIFQQSVVVGTLALGQTLIILIAGIDLANGAIMVMGQVFAAAVLIAKGNPGVAMLACALVCVGLSAFNGLVIVRFRLPPFIATLGLFTVLTAAARLLSNSRSFPIQSDFMTALGVGLTYGRVTVTYGSVLWVLLTLILGYILTETAWGVRVYAIGNSPAAARLNGVDVSLMIFSVYALAGGFYAFGAWQALGRTPVVDAASYPLANLDSITAVVIGGTSLFGGRGGVAGTFLGTLIVVILKNGLTQAGINSLYQQIATGFLVMLAVAFDQYLRRVQSRS